MVKLLLGRQNVDVNYRDDKGRIPLALVAWDGHEAVVKLLLERQEVPFQRCREFYCPRAGLSCS